MNDRNSSLIVFSGLALAGLFLVLDLTLGHSDLIVVLNGVLVGALVSIGITYRPIIIGALRGRGKYNDVQQMTIGFFLVWLSVSVGVGFSIYYRAIGFEFPNSTYIAVSRYLAIIAAFLQITAPDFGLGLFNGREKKVMFPAMIIGAAVAFFLIWGQAEAVLK